MYCLFKDDDMVKVPKSVLSCELPEDFLLPAMAKPINGRSSEGLKKIYKREDLVGLKSIDNYIVQELLDGNVFTVDYVRNALSGDDFAVPREELLRTKNGAGTTVRVVPNEDLMAITSYIGRKLGVNGCVNMEYIHYNGAYYLIDINPRFSAGVAFSNFIGYSFFIRRNFIEVIIFKMFRIWILTIVCWRVTGRYGSWPGPWGYG